MNDANRSAADKAKRSNIIVFEDENGEAAEFEVVEQTTLGGVNYLFVVDCGQEEFLILRENGKSGDADTAAYDIVDDENELEAVVRIFDELLEDVDLEV